jgi:hypothetical protein
MGEQRIENSTLAGGDPKRRAVTESIRGDGERVRHLQAALARLGFYAAPVDGDFGPRTEAAVRAFQASRRLAEDGVVGGATWEALDAAGAVPPSATPDVWLSKRLSLATFCRTDRVAFLSLQANPPADALANGRFLATEVLDPLWDLWGGFIPGSLWRCEALNKAVGGSMNPPSAHLDGRAADLKPARRGYVDAMTAVAESRLPFDKVIFERKALAHGCAETWIHIQVRKFQPDGRAGTPRRIALMSFDAKRFELWNPSDARVRALAHERRVA